LYPFSDWGTFLESEKCETMRSHLQAAQTNRNRRLTTTKGVSNLFVDPALNP
jgi:hypothetical protein